MDNLALIITWLTALINRKMDESKKDKERDESKRTAQTIIYLNAYQDSGSNLSVTGNMRAVCIL